MPAMANINLLIYARNFIVTESLGAGTCLLFPILVNKKLRG